MRKKSTNATINVRGTEITVIRRDDEDYISLTDMLKAKDGDFFISDWLRNRNTVEFLGIWETVHNPDFNSGEFAIIKTPQGLRRHKCQRAPTDRFSPSSSGDYAMARTHSLFFDNLLDT